MSVIALELPIEHGPPSTLKDFVTLTKPGVMLLVVFTGAIGMWMAPGHLPPLLQFMTLLCIAMGSGAGGAINMWFDRDIDQWMKRTAGRPLPAGRIEPNDALTLGIGLALASVILLGIAVSWAAAWLLAFSIWFYAGIYTMLLKRSTPQNIVIGGAAGAFPAVIGWLAVTPNLTWTPLFYFLIVFLWTPPHFWALALYRSEDYRKAGIPMLPVTHGIVSTKRHILAYTCALVGSSLLPFANGSSGAAYVVIALGLGGVFLWHAWRVYRSDEPRNAMKLFGFSITYLFLLFSALILDKLIFFIL